MVFTPPFTAVPGEKITAAGHNTSIRDNINHIWGVLGGNPGTNNLVPVSTGATSAAWAKVPDVALADPKISQHDVFITDSNTPLLTGIFEQSVPAANAPFSGEWYILNTRYRDLGVHYAFQIAMNLTGGPLYMYARAIFAGTPQPWHRMWNSAAMGNGSGLDADTLRALIPGAAAGNIPINNGSLNATLNAALLGSAPAGNASGNIPINNGVMNTNLNAQFLQGLVPGNASANIPINNTGLNVGLNAQFLGGASLGNAANQVPVNNSVLNTGLNAQFLQGFIPSNASGGLAVNNGGLNTNLNAQFLQGQPWFTPIQIDATGSDVDAGGGVLNIAGLTWTCTRTGSYRIGVSCVQDNTGQLSGVFDKQIRIRRTGSATVTSAPRTIVSASSAGTYGGNRATGFSEWVMPLVAGDVLTAQCVNRAGSIQSLTIAADSYMIVTWHNN